MLTAVGFGDDSEALAIQIQLFVCLKMFMTDGWGRVRKK